MTTRTLRFIGASESGDTVISATVNTQLVFEGTVTDVPGVLFEYQAPVDFGGDIEVAVTVLGDSGVQILHIESNYAHMGDTLYNPADHAILQASHDKNHRVLSACSNEFYAQVVEIFCWKAVPNLTQDDFDFVFQDDWDNDRFNNEYQVWLAEHGLKWNVSSGEEFVPIVTDSIVIESRSNISHTYVIPQGLA